LHKVGVDIEEEAGSNSTIQQHRIGYTDLVNQSIQPRRARVTVPYGAGGTLTDYVPFYFAPRAPMLYAIHQGNVSTYSEGQESLVYLVSTIEAVQQANFSFAFTDGHDIMALMIRNNNFLDSQ
jgi:hypothetical protein